MKRCIMVTTCVAACGGGDSDPRPMMFGDDRPAVLDVPATFDDSRDYPLIVALHGFGGNGFQHAAYFGLNKLVDMDEAIMIAPDGTTDPTGRQFWNADPMCCDFHNKNPDDVAYLGKLVDDIVKAWPIDKRRVVIIGHSNGGYMAYRMACARPDVITAIAGLAGAAASMPATCTPSQSVNVLHIHGTADATVPYTVAEPSVQQWVGHAGCGTTLAAGATLDLDAALAGAETQALTAPCPTGVGVELWKIEGGSHIPNFGAGFTPALWQWLKDHPRN